MKNKETAKEIVPLSNSYFKKEAWPKNRELLLWQIEQALHAAQLETFERTKERILKKFFPHTASNLCQQINGMHLWECLKSLPFDGDSK